MKLGRPWTVWFSRATLLASMLLVSAGCEAPQKREAPLPSPPIKMIYQPPPEPKPEPVAPRADELRPTVRPAAPVAGQNAIYDEANPAFPALQKANEALLGFPLDRQAGLDWVGALDRGIIRPRSSVRSDAAPQLLELDILMKNTKEMPWVKFPHRAHTQWLDCINCHPAIFEPKAGAHAIDMAEIFRGNYCGACHGRVAFVPHLACERCHSVPQPGQKVWWQ